MFSILEKTKSSIVVRMDNVDVAVANALRRVILSEIPNAAFDVDLHGGPCDIVVHKNQSSMHNEFLMHRLSLLPLCFDEEEIDSFDSSRYKFVLKVKNNGTEMKTVTTKDFVILNPKGKQYPKEFHDKIFPKNPVTGDYILITRLKPNLSDPTKGDEIDLEAHASINIAKKHSCWCPVSVCTYHNTIDEELASVEYERVKDSVSRARFDTLDKYRCFKTNKYGEPNSFVFTIESECRLSPSYIFSKAIDVLMQKLDGLSTRAHQLKMSASDSNVVSIVIEDEDHTLGNLMQAMTYNYMIRDQESPKVSYVGYFMPHPLENIVVLKLKINDSSVTPQQVLKDTCSVVRKNLEELRASWAQVVKD